MKRSFAAFAFAALVSTPALVANTFRVTNTSDSGVGSLRQAIIDANRSPGTDTIAFAIPASGVQSIVPLSALPAITGPVVIDGFTQPKSSPNSLAVGDNSVHLIELNGNGGSFAGLSITAGNSTVRGLVINRFINGDSIDLASNGSNTVQGCFINVDATGATDLSNGNTRGAILITTPGNVIGGTSPQTRNVVNGPTYALAVRVPASGANADGNTIQGNYIGTNAQGSAALNSGSGVGIETSNNVIGGTTPGAGNVIAGTGGCEIRADSNFIQGNLVGTTADGTAALSNNGGGVTIFRCANCLVGGPTAAARNVIAGSSGVSVFNLSAAGVGSNTIQGNYIGTNQAGTAILPVGGGAGAGISIDSSTKNLILGNVVAGYVNGVVIRSTFPAADNNTVQGNFIGTNAGATAALPNQQHGLLIFGGGNSPITHNTVVGGTAAGTGNVISGNGFGGIQIVGAQDSRIQGNLIGLAANGSTLLPNGGTGIEINDNNNSIGGVAAGAGNTIAFNSGPGVNVLGTAIGSGILSNSIYGNRGAGILLGSGAPANDPGDADAGPNGYQNYPVLTSATNASPNTVITGTLNSTPNTTFHLEFFATSVLDAPSTAQAENLIGTLDVTTDAKGDVSFNKAFAQVGDGRWITGTATDPSGNTSQLSAAIAVAGPTFVNATAITARNGLPFRFQLVSSGGSSSQRLRTSGLPPGLQADAVTGVISGTPTTDGNYDVTLQLFDGVVTATGTLLIQVVSDPTIPVILSPSETTVTPGKPFTYKINAPTSTSAADPLPYSLQGVLPAGLGFDETTGTISGTLNAIQSAGPPTVEPIAGSSSAMRSPGPPPKIEPLSGGVITNVQLFAKNANGTATKPLVFFLAPVGTVNISTRMSVGTGENVMIAGFIITGNAPKKVILRAIGPSLNGTVAGALQNPTLQLFDGGGVSLGSNDDWRSNQEQEILDTGIPPKDDHESAAVATLAPANYTAVVSGVDQSTGIAVVEAYDLGTASLDTSSNAQLAQISTRGKVLAGQGAMIGGFIISGSSVNILLRGIGPSLSNAGIANPLADPTLSLVDSNGSELANNDNWKDTQRSAIEATMVPPQNDAEAAIVRTLDPGAYTAILRGKDGGTGVALVEVYHLP